MTIRNEHKHRAHKLPMHSDRENERESKKERAIFSREFLIELEERVKANE